MEDRSEHHARPHMFRLGAIGGMIGAITYSSFLLEALFRTGLNPLSSYISELSVPGRPYAFLFRTGDMIAGCGLLVLAMALARRLPASPRVRGDAWLWPSARQPQSPTVCGPCPVPRPPPLPAAQPTVPTWASSCGRSTLCRA